MRVTSIAKSYYFITSITRIVFLEVDIEDRALVKQRFPEASAMDDVFCYACPMHGELSETEINHFLSEEVFGHLGCSEDNKPYVVPMAYVFHDQVIYGQTTEGKKVQILRKNPLVCFQVEALHDGKWSSVVCWGTFEEMDFEELQKPVAIEAVKLLTKAIGSIQHQVGISAAYSFTGKAEPMTVNEKKSTLFRIVVHEKTGRFYIAE